MKEPCRLATPPSKPLMMFDGDCHFCTLWIKRWRQMTEDFVDYLPYQDSRTAGQFPELPRDRLEKAVHLVEADGAVYSGAEAVFRALACHPSRRTLRRWYEANDGFAAVSERAYRFVAEHRQLFSWMTRIGWGKHVERADYFLARWVFLRSLGVIYLIAFVSLWMQILGLVGHNGILPAQQFMSAVEQQATLQRWGLGRFRMVPTLCWASASDASLQAQCASGVVLSVLLMAGVAPAPCLFLLWLVYLSLSTVCREFLGFQWDILLLETGFLAIFFAPLTLLPRPSREPAPSRLWLWLLRLLLFKLMFQSGCVKLLSGDEMWHKLTALTVHYETQPLPTWLGWWAHQAPVWFQKASCAGMFCMELAVPFLIFAPRRLRFAGGGVLVALQVAILLTGNYTFFNWLTLALCVLLLDDFVLGRITPAFLKKVASSPQPPIPWASEAREKPGMSLSNSDGSSAAGRRREWPRFIMVPLAVFVLSMSLLPLVARFGLRSPLLKPVAAVYSWLLPFRSFSSYGLFAVMTNPRMEIVVEGSNDGQNWLAYEFKYKPGALERRPGFVAPHQPRLDWQMWFAALGTWRRNPWFINFCFRLLQGSPEVVSLLEKNPFRDQPPKYIRAELYEYHFTTIGERRKTGAWWKRELRGEYLPGISIDQLKTRD